VTEKSALYASSTLIIFTYAPAGLGHLRVVNALSEGLEDKKSLVLLGASDKNIEAIHKFTSINLIARAMMEYVQRSFLQTLSTKLYRNYLRSSSYKLYDKINEIIDERIHCPKTIVFACTHFGLAHQLSVIKEKLEKERSVHIILAVQVTDDSPQYIWYVPGSDVIFVPSIRTKETLEAYAVKSKLPSVNIEVVPYPVNPLLGEQLSDSRKQARKNQLNSVSNDTVNIAIPISGAAVSMFFYQHLIKSLSSKSRDCKFHVVSKLAPFTNQFLDSVKNLDNVKIYVSSYDREVVDLYDEMYQKEIISLEVTKPSEQAFKALFSSDQIGGSILLFSDPVGRQESDNLAFLRSHGMIFTEDENRYLWAKAEKSESISDLSMIDLFENKGKMRGLELPWGSIKSSNYIWWCLKHGIFEQIYEHGLYKPKSPEIDSSGVALFWKRIEHMI
jgi:hypothetical protein